jgi:SAM-dependent methyltransferase
MRADWYEYPGWYDILHTPGTANEVDGLARIEGRFARASRRRLWLEPACGTGRLLRVAAGRGIAVAGFDRGERMIDYARASFASRGLKGRLFVADMTRFTLPRRATFAFCPINTIRHLESDRAMLDHFACMRRALAPQGVYVVGTETCRYGVDFPTEDVWTGRRGHARIRQVVQYLPPSRRDRVERVVSHLVITTPKGEQHLSSAYDLRAYSRSEWDALLCRAGWRVLGVCDAEGRDALRGPRGGVIGGYGLYVLAPG